MSHVVNSCPLTKLAGGLLKLHAVDNDAATWLTNYGGPWKMHTTTTLLCVVVWKTANEVEED